MPSGALTAFTASCTTMHPTPFSLGTCAAWCKDADDNKACMDNCKKYLFLSPGTCHWTFCAKPYGWAPTCEQTGCGNPDDCVPVWKWFNRESPEECMDWATKAFNWGQTKPKP